MGDTVEVVRMSAVTRRLAELPYREALEKDVKLADEVPAALAPWRSWLAKKDAAAVRAGAGNPPALGQSATGDRRHQAALGPGRRAMGETGRGGPRHVRDVLPGGREGSRRLSASARSSMRKAWSAFRNGLAWYTAAIGPSSSRSVKPSKHNVLAGLPDGPFVFAGGGPLLRGDDAQADEFLFRHDEEHARDVRAERGTGRDVLRAWQRDSSRRSAAFPSCSARAKAANRSLPGCWASCG